MSLVGGMDLPQILQCFTMQGLQIFLFQEENIT